MGQPACLCCGYRQAGHGFSAAAWIPASARTGSDEPDAQVIEACPRPRIKSGAGSDRGMARITDGSSIVERSGMDMDPSFGEDVAKMVRNAVNQLAENIALLKQIIKVE